MNNFSSLDKILDNFLSMLNKDIVCRKKMTINEDEYNIDNKK